MLGDPLRNGGEDERAVVGAVSALTQKTGGGRCGGDLVVGIGAGGGDDEAHPVEVAGGEATAGEGIDVPGVDLRRHRRRDVGSDDPHERPGAGQTGDLAGGYRSGPDDEDGHAGEVEGDRVGEPRSHSPERYPPANPTPPGTCTGREI